MVRTSSLVSLCLVSMTAIASAQAPADDAAGAPAVPGGPDPVAAAAPAPAPDPNASAAMMQPPPNPEPSGPTLRNGFSLSVGQEFGTSSLMNDFSGQLYGIDWRIGAQINKALGVYLHSHLSLGSISQNDQTAGYTGNFAAALTGEYQLPMRLFFGAGAGYGVLNNPSGPLVQGRAGYYLFESKDPGKSRRLNVALDFRVYFVSVPAESVTMKHVALSIGYDRF